MTSRKQIQSGREVTVRPARLGGGPEAAVALCDLLPLDALAAELGDHDEARIDVSVRVDVEAARGTGEATVNVRVPVILRRKVEDLPICVDFGASAIGVWVGRPGANGEGTRLSRLPLGRWHEAIDPAHDESRQVTGDPESCLIPSQVGLSSRQNLRAGFDPARLGTLDLAQDGEKAIEGRLRHLDRRYDVSIPFPNAAALPDHLGEVVLDLKRRLTTDATSFSLERPVYQRDRASDRTRLSDRVDVPSLFSDSVDEILKLYAARAIARGSGAAPSGCCRGCGWCSPIPPASDRNRSSATDAPPPLSSRGRGGPDDPRESRDVVLYPEAVAAARFALDSPSSRRHSAAPPRTENPTS